jgi:hypothetical protein
MRNRLFDRASGALIGALAIALVATLAGVVRAGPLDPSGPPSSTDGVLRPGTPISSLPFTIEAPGMYYVTRNLSGQADSAGITIASSGVTLDLGGFELRGGIGSLDGIIADGSIDDIVVMNGTIDFWGGGGVIFSFPTFAVGSHVHDLEVHGNNGDGIRVGDRAIVEGVTSRANGGIGISASRDSVIQRCTVSDNNGDGVHATFNAVITDCTVARNNGDGIYAGQGSTVRGNAVSQSGGDGIEIGVSAIADQNESFLNGTTVADGAGVHATGGFDRITDNNVTGNDRGLWVEQSVSLITGNSAISNGDNYGQVASSNLFGPVLNTLTIDDAGANPHANFSDQ